MSGDVVSVEVGGHAIESWSEYSVMSDLLSPSDGFQLRFDVGGDGVQEVSTARDRLRDVLAPGSDVKIFVERQGVRSLQLTGVIDEVEVTSSRERGTSFEISGRDLASLLVDSTCEVKLGRGTTATFLDVVRAAVEPFGIPIASDNGANRDLLTGRAVRVPEARRNAEGARTHGVSPDAYGRRQRARAARLGVPIDTLAGQTPSASARRRASNRLAPGDVERLQVSEARPGTAETIWEFLDRHARRLGLLMWFSADGWLVVTAPRYDQAPAARLVQRFVSVDDDPNNVISGSVVRNVSESYSVVKVFGRGADRRSVVATTVDPELPDGYQKTLVVRDKSVRTTDEAVRRGNREVARGRARSLTCSYVVHDHGQGQLLFATDTIVSVCDEVCGVTEDMYCVSRTFRRTREHGTTTELRLVRKGAIVL